MIEEDTMNPNLTWAIAAERMQTLQEAGTAARARHSRRTRRGLAFAPAGSGR